MLGFFAGLLGLSALAANIKACPGAANARQQCRKAKGKWLVGPDCRCVLPGQPIYPVAPMYQQPQPQYYPPAAPVAQYYAPPPVVQQPQYPYGQSYGAYQQYPQYQQPNYNYYSQPSYEYGLPNAGYSTGYSYGSGFPQGQYAPQGPRADSFDPIVDPTSGNEDSMGLPSDFVPFTGSVQNLPTLDAPERPTSPVSPVSGSYNETFDPIGDSLVESNGEGLFGLGLTHSRRVRPGADARQRGMDRRHQVIAARRDGHRSNPHIKTIALKGLSRYLG